MAFVSSGGDIKNSNIYSIIVLFTYLTLPLGILPFMFASLNKFATSYRRMRTFLHEEEIDCTFITAIYQKTGSKDI